MDIQTNVRAVLVALVSVSFVITGCTRQALTSLASSDDALSRNLASLFDSPSTGETVASESSQSDSTDSSQLVQSNEKGNPNALGEPPLPTLRGSEAGSDVGDQGATGEGNRLQARISDSKGSSAGTQEGSHALNPATGFNEGGGAFIEESRIGDSPLTGGSQESRGSSSSGDVSSEDIRPLADQDVLTAMAAASGKSTPGGDMVGSESARRPGDDIIPLGNGMFGRRGLEDVFFDFDASTIRSDAVSALQANAQILKVSFEDRRVVIEGHCDERGTSEYNLVLGERRAQSTKQYLVDLGVSASSIQTISYGKERPFCTASEPNCWKMNRRGHFVLQ